MNARESRRAGDFESNSKVKGAGAEQEQMTRAFSMRRSESRFSHNFARVPAHPATSAAATCKGKPYDGATQCCEAKGILPKKPIENLDDCPKRTADPDHKPSFNGCGGGGMAAVIPNNPNQLDVSCVIAGQTPSFETACNAHDICYETCNSSKKKCDGNFLVKMLSLCSPLTNTACRESCNHNAFIYYTAVDQGGDSFYDDAQKAACKCCP